MTATTSTSTREEILTPGEVAEWLGVTVQALANWRYLRRGPEYVQLGRMVRYTRASIDRFIAAGRVQTSAEVTA